MSFVSEITLKYSATKMKSEPIISSDSAVRVLRSIFNEDLIEYSEEFNVLFLNRANKVIHSFKVSEGGLSATVVDVRKILVAALNCGAHSMVLSHNHPSGGLKPSDPDLKLTNKIIEAGKLLEIKVLDHIILTADSYFSFLDNGYM